MNPRLSLLALVATALLVSSSLAQDYDEGGDAKESCFRDLLPEELAEAKLLSRATSIVKSTKILPGNGNPQQIQAVSDCLKKVADKLPCTLNTTTLIQILASSPNAADALPAAVNYVNKYANDHFKNAVLDALKECSKTL